MGRLFWIFMAIVGVALILLISSHDQGMVFGLRSEEFGSAVYLSIFAALIAAAILGRGMRFGDVARQMVIWVVIILALMTAFLFRYEAQDLASRISGGLLPGSPISRISDDGRKEVTLIRANNGHFGARGTVNGKPVRFLVDTGASSVVLSHRDALAAGIDPNRLSFTVPVFTANGRTMSAEAMIDVMAIGSIVRTGKKVLVSAPGALGESLLGMSFLGTLSSYEVRGDRMFLRD